MSEHRRPGRPQIADPDGIALAAVALFARDGYDAVTMDDVAAASGVSRRTLFRHFASKADLVWRDFFATYARLSERAEQEEVRPGLDGVRDLLRDGLDLPEDREANARVRLRIIGSSPEVFAAGISGLVQVTQGLERHLARHGDLPEGGLEVRVSAQSVVGAFIAAAVWWAEHSDERLAVVVDRGLAGLAAGIR